MSAAYVTIRAPSAPSPPHTVGRRLDRAAVTCPFAVARGGRDPVAAAARVRTYVPDPTVVEGALEELDAAFDALASFLTRADDDRIDRALRVRLREESRAAAEREAELRAWAESLEGQLVDEVSAVRGTLATAARGRSPLQLAQDPRRPRRGRDAVLWREHERSLAMRAKRSIRSTKVGDAAACAVGAGPLQPPPPACRGTRHADGMNVERALAEAPDPALARTAWERVIANRDAREVLDRPMVAPVAIAATRVLARGGGLPREVSGRGRSVRWRRARARGSPRESSSDIEGHGPAAGLRRFRRRAMLRVAARDLEGAGLDEVVREITDIADLPRLLAWPGGSRSVIALGKWGGRELNYSTDVDLLFVHRPSPTRTRPPSGSRRELLQLPSEPTADGVALRVDAALRPGGRAGALIRSLEATLAYYQRGSATWERQAMIKARRAAGDLDLGQAFVTGVRRSCTPSTSSRPRSTTSAAPRCASRSTYGGAARSSRR